MVIRHLRAEQTAAGPISRSRSTGTDNHRAPSVCSVVCSRIAIRSASTSRAAKAKDRLAVLLDQGNHLVLQQGDLLLAIGLLDPDAARWQMADSVDWMAITIGASCVAATGAIPAEARPKEGLKLERGRASRESQGDFVVFCHPAFVQL